MYIPFLIVANRLGQDTEKAVCYINGTENGYPNLGHNLRFDGNIDKPFNLKIDQDDANVFVARVMSWRRENDPTYPFYKS